MANILIGLGGTGGKILKAFRQRLWTEHAKEKREKLSIGFIYVDSDRGMLDPTDMTYETIHGNCCFDNQDFVDIKTHSDVDAIFSNPKAYPRLAGILGNVAETQAAVGSIGAAAEQKRRAGRILFAANIDSYVSKFARVVQQMNDLEVNGELNIYIFAGLAGGTGSGCIIDTIAQTRKWLFEHNYDEKKFRVIVFCQIPEDTPKPNWDTGRYKANGYGALLELNNLFSSHYNAEWGNKGNKPVYDVTSHVGYARLYLSYNEPTTDNVQAGRIPHELKIAGGLLLYSNKNEQGYTINEPVELAQIVANFVYTYIFTPGGEVKEEFGRFVSFENIDMIGRDEYDEMANPELTDPLPVRTRAIGSFGIKRIVVPEIEIQEYISYSLGCGALNQLEYGNWSAQAGYRREIVNFDAVSYVKDEGHRESWKLSRPYFLLKKYILEGDVREGWPEGEFARYWSPCIDAWEKVARKAKNEFGKLIELCRGGYESGFRGKGVEHFFNDKQAVIAEAYSIEITKKVENNLFELWASGRLSLATLEDITAKLFSEIRKETNKFVEEDIPALEKKIQGNEQAINMIVKEYLDSGVLVRPVIFNNRFTKVIELSKTLYCQKTELAAMRIFAQPLCQSLENHFDGLHQRVCDFQKQVAQLYIATAAHQSALTDTKPTDISSERDGLEAMNQATIEFYKRNRLIELENRLLHDQEKMDSISESVRKALVDALQSEGRFINKEKINKDILPAILLGPVYTQIEGFHNKLCQEANTKVLGIPILKRLYQKYAGNPLALKQFAKDIFTASGVFTEIDMNQIQQKNANTPAPDLGKNILFKRILVNLPKCEDNELAAFCEDLKNAIIGAIPGGTNAGIVVEVNNLNQNEISVLTLVNDFPMRAIKAVPMLKAEYDRLTSTDPKNKILLQTEGRTDDYKGLFACPPKTAAEIREEVIPQLIVNLSLKTFMKDEASEEYGPCELDFFGNASVTPWGHCDFLEIPYDDRLVEEKQTQIVKLFNESLASAFGTIDTQVRSLVEAKKKEIENDIMSTVGLLMKSVSKNSQQYKDFIRWTQMAVGLVKDFKCNA